MKKNILIGIATFLILAMIIILFVTKNVVDNKASEIAKEELPKILEKAKNDLEALDLPSSITYQNVSVSSVGGHLLLEDVNITDNNGPSFFCDEIKIGTSYKELFSMIKSQDFNEINSFFLEFENINIIRSFSSVNSGSSNHKIANNIRIDYDGRLTKEMIKNIEYEFPPENQKLTFTIKGLNIPEEEYYLLGIQNIIRNFEPSMLKTDLNFSLEFSPKQKQFGISNIYSKNKIGFFEGDFILKYYGTNPNNITVNKISAIGKSDVDYKGIEIQNENMSMTLGRGDMNFDVSISGDLDEMDDSEIFQNALGDIKISFKDFTITPSYDMIREVQRDFPDFKLKNNKLDFSNIGGTIKWDGRRFTNNINISSSLATIKSNIDMNLKFDRRGEPDFSKSRLNKCVLRIGNLDKNLEELIEGLESQMLMGQSLPRKGNDIVLNVTGSFSNPEIEGLNF